MKIEDYNKYIQKEDIYVIPKDIFEELFNELENFRKDYNTYRKLIEHLKQDIFRMLGEENER